MQVGAAVGGAGDAGADDVADAIKESALLLCKLDGGQRVGRLAALAHRYDHIVGIDDGVAVAELGGILNLDGYLCSFLDEIFADERRVPRGAAGADDYAAGIDEFVLVFYDTAEGDILALVVQTAFDAGAQGVGLLPDLLEHKVREATLLQLVEREAEGVHFRGLVHIGEVHNVNLAAAVHVSNLLVLEVYHLLGVLHDGRGVAAEVELLLSTGIGADAYHQRRTLAGAHQLVGVVLLQDGYGIGADDILQGALHGGEEVALLSLLRVLNKLHQHLGVGVGAEVIALLLQLGAQRLVVLDDAVMHQREIAALREMRVGVDGVGLAVGGPTGVGDTDAAGSVLGGTLLLQRSHLAGGLVHIQIAFGVDHTDAGRVIAAIFQSMKTLYQNGVSLLLTDITYYSTHIVTRFKIICKSTNNY